MNLLCLTQEKLNIITTYLPRRVAFECSLGIVSLSRANINLAGEGLWPYFARNRFKMFNETIARRRYRTTHNYQNASICRFPMKITAAIVAYLKPQLFQKERRRNEMNSVSCRKMTSL